MIPVENHQMCYYLRFDKFNAILEKVVRIKVKAKAKTRKRWENLGYIIPFFDLGCIKFWPYPPNERIWTVELSELHQNHDKNIPKIKCMQSHAPIIADSFSIWMRCCKGKVANLEYKTSRLQWVLCGLFFRHCVTIVSPYPDINIV